MLAANGELAGEHQVILAHRRLAILDVSPAGHQPMCDEAGRWIVYNGEIYNFIELKRELESHGYRFQTDSDTEVVLAAYDHWGESCIDRFNGMWAFCIYDPRQRKAFVSRDRFGIKPLYYVYNRRLFAFASELKSLLEIVPGGAANSRAISNYLCVGVVDNASHTFFSHLKKLEAGHSIGLHAESKEFNKRRFWDLRVEHPLREDIRDQDIEAFQEHFSRAVRLRLRSDVTVGSCLSGGLDSSSVVCVAAQEWDSAQTGQFNTFTSCFEDRRFDERQYANVVSDLAGTKSNLVFPQIGQLIENLDRLIWHQDEPFNSSSIYAQWAVFESAGSRNVKVMLDGQGGDEQLGGYRKFYFLFIRQLLQERMYARAMVEATRFFGSRSVLRTLGVRKGLRYFSWGRKWLNAEQFMNQDLLAQDQHRPRLELGSNMGDRIHADLFQFSLPALLRYEDRNSMAHSVEARLPFLDHHFAEFVARLPVSHRVSNGWTKRILRSAMKGILPEKVRLRRSKLGFSTPEDAWMKAGLCDAIETEFERGDFLNQVANVRRLREAFRKYQSGGTQYPPSLFFRYLLLERWAKTFAITNCTEIESTDNDISTSINDRCLSTTS